MNYIRLTDKEKSSLEELRKISVHHRERVRAHAILLSNKMYDVTSLCDIFEVERAAIYRWMKNWKEQGIDGLKERPGRGRKPILNETDKKKF